MDTCRVGRGRGWTLTEVLILLALLGLLAAWALPSFGALLMRHHLQGVAAQVHADLQYLRSEATARNTGVLMSFAAVDGGSCYLIHTGRAGACRCLPGGSVNCESDALLLRQVRLEADGPVQVRANVPALRVDPRYGTVSPTGRVQVVALDGSQIDHVVSLLGRVSSCAPAQPVAGVAACK